MVINSPSSEDLGADLATGNSWDVGWSRSQPGKVKVKAMFVSISIPSLAHICMKYNIGDNNGRDASVL